MEEGAQQVQVQALPQSNGGLLCTLASNLDSHGLPSFDLSGLTSSASALLSLQLCEGISPTSSPWEVMTRWPLGVINWEVGFTRAFLGQLRPRFEIEAVSAAA